MLLIKHKVNDQVHKWQHVAMTPQSPPLVMQLYSVTDDCAVSYVLLPLEYPAVTAIQAIAVIQCIAAEQYAAVV